MFDPELDISVFIDVYGELSINVGGYDGEQIEINKEQAIFAKAAIDKYLRGTLEDDV